MFVSLILFPVYLTTACFRPGSYYGSACRRNRESQKVSKEGVSKGLFDYLTVALMPSVQPVSVWNQESPSSCPLVPRLGILGTTSGQRRHSQAIDSQSLDAEQA
jgi:hypothetical protein